MTKEKIVPSSPTPTPVCPPSTGYRILTTASFITLILTLFAFLTALYAISMAQKNQHTVLRLQTDFNDYRHQSSDLESSLATLNEAHASLQTELSNLTLKINTTPAEKDNTLWAAEQARYYLELADMEALWENNGTACLILLKQAEKTLHAIQDLSLQPILIEVQQAEQKITDLPKPDLTYLLKKFHQLEETLLKAAPPMISKAETETSTTSSVQSHSQQALNTLKKLIVIKQHAPSELPPSSLKEALLINRINLNLQAAKLALLQNNTTLYEAALSQARIDVDAVFENQPDIKQSITETIQQLAQIKLIGSLPSIKTPLEQLKLWIKAHEAHPSLNPAPQS
jgi:uroporphyrin-III C-methyltransferase